jgi:molecular chaperone GrpE
MTDEPRIEEQSEQVPDEAAQPPVRDSGRVEGVRGNREVPPAPNAEAVEDERLAALEDQLKRVAADFDNFRKRAVRERADTVAFANERLVKELLPILDDLERALVAAHDHEEAKLIEGVQLVHRSLETLLQREGLKEIETEGQFDPHVHEALLSQPSEQDEGAVIDVLQKGYKLGDRVLRPARVVVAGPRSDG